MYLQLCKNTAVKTMIMFIRMGALFHRWGRFLFCGRVNISLQFDSKDRGSLLNKVLKKKKKAILPSG